MANPVLATSSGLRVVLADGLLGYVLGGSGMSWTIEPSEGPLSTPGRAALMLGTPSGTVNVPVEVQTGR